MENDQEVAKIAQGLTKAQREAVSEAFKAGDGFAPKYCTGSIFELERGGLARPTGAWALLTPLGIAVRTHLLANTGDA